MRQRTSLVVVAGISTAAALSGVMAGCAQSSTLSPPTTICGHSMARTGEGTELHDGTHPGVITVTSTSPGRVVLISLTSDCAHGVTIRIVPANSMRVSDEATAADGRLAGIELRPRAKIAEIVANHGNGRITRIRIRLARA